MREFDLFDESFDRLTNYSLARGHGSIIPADIKDSIYFFTGEEDKGKKPVLRISVGDTVLNNMGIKPGDRVDFVWSRKRMIAGIIESPKGIMLSRGRHSDRKSQLQYSQARIVHRMGMPITERRKYIRVNGLSFDRERKAVKFNLPPEVFF